MSADLRALRDQLEQALQRDRPRDALAVLDRLEAEEPDKARWPHRRGDLLRKLGQRREAVDAYERAVARYSEEGFVARAVALAKLVSDLDPSRGELLRRVDPRQAATAQAPRGPSPEAPRGPLPSSMIRGTPVSAMRNLGQAAEPEVRPLGRIALEKREVEVVAGQPLAAAAAVVPGSAAVARAPALDPSLMLAAAGTDPALRRSALIDVEIDVDLSELTLDIEVGDREDEPSADVLKTLPAFPLFAQTPPEALQLLVQSSDVIELEDGAVVVQKGEVAEELFAIIEGRVRVEIPELPLAERPRLSEGEVFGESCLFQGEPRKADVVVDGRLFALRIPRDTLLQVAHAHARLGEVLFQLLARRLIENLTRTSPLFRPFDAPTRIRLARLFELKRTAAGMALFEEGKRSGGVYVPLTGRVEVKGGLLGARAEIGPGVLLGQDSLLSQTPAATTARTLVDMMVLRLPSVRFLEIASEYPAALEELSELADPSTGLFALELG